MVRPLGQDHNSLRIKPLRGNAIGLNLLGMRKILGDRPQSAVKTESGVEPFTIFKPRFKRFNYELQSSRWRSEQRIQLCNDDSEDVFSNVEKETTDALTNTLMQSKPEDLSSVASADTVVCHKKTKFEKFFHEDCQDKQTQRKYRTKDEFGNIVRRVRANKRKVRKITSPKQSDGGAAERLNRLVLNIRCFKVGTLTKIFRRSDTLTAQCTFTVDYIEIANKVRIEASEVTCCEWCTVQKLPSLFLQTTPAACRRLRVQLVRDAYEDHSWVWYDCQSKNQDEKYLVLIFEKELTFPEQLTLEEIFTEISRSNNICNFLVKLPFEEANSRLKTHTCAQKQQITAPQPEEDVLPVMSQEFSCLSLNVQQALVPLSPSPDPTRCEIATLSVSDSDEDLVERPSSPIQEIKKLVVFPPPPAKGGITITEEDLRCLEEGKFLNDVILDFYLRFLMCEQLKRDDAIKCHVFSSFFFKHLTQEDHRRPPETTGLSVPELRHNRVKTWTRHVNIFEKDFIFVPINQKSHWYLAVICFPGQISQTSDSNLCVSGQRHSSEYLCDQSPPNPMSLFYCPESSEHNSTWIQSTDDLNKSFWLHSDDEAEDIQVVESASIHNSKSNSSKRPCILIMDSLNCRVRSSVVRILQEYLQEEWRVKKGYRQSFGTGVMDGWSPRVPQQDNFTDCGIYLLHYVERFLKDPPQAFYPSMDLNDWFSQKTVKKKRQQIKRLILKLHREQTV